MRKYDIFISYRRQGGYETAKHLYDLFTRDGYKVSFDIDTLRNGDFDNALLKRIDQCTDFILILNQGAFDRTLDPHFNPKQDWMRIELAYALKKQKNIIPIMLEGFKGFPDNLPVDIAQVVKKNAPQYNRYYFDEFYKKLRSDFLETRKSRYPLLKILLVILVMVIGAAGIWWYRADSRFGEKPEQQNNRPDTLQQTLLPGQTEPGPESKNALDREKTAFTEKVQTEAGGQDKAAKKSPPANVQSKDQPVVKEVKLPEWMFRENQKYIGVVPAGLGKTQTEEFAVALTAYQWIIAQGKSISGRDTTMILSLENHKSLIYYFTSPISFDYRVENHIQLTGGEEVFEISFFNSKRKKYTLELWGNLVVENNNTDYTLKMSFTGFDHLKSYEFTSLGEDNSALTQSYMNGREIEYSPISGYADGGRFIKQALASGDNRTENLQIGDFKSLSEAWQHYLATLLPFSPAGSVSCSIKSIVNSDGMEMTLTNFTNDHISPFKMICNGVKDNLLSITLKNDEAKTKEFMNEEAMKKKMADGLKEIDNFGK